MTDVKRGRGQPPKFTPEELSTKIDEYIEYCKENKEWANKKGFAIFANVYKNLPNVYAKSDKYSGALDKLSHLSENSLIQKGLNGEYNAAITKTLLSANYGISESKVIAGDKENPLNVNVTISSLLDEDIEEDN